jgi:Family of unknown function (DUF5519)
MNASERIVGEVTSWPGVTAAPHRFGGVEFRLGRRELGHLHGSHMADIPFPRRLHDELIAAGRVREHRWVPDSGWSTRDIRSAEDVDDVIALLRLNYERATKRAAQRVAG